MTKRRKEVTNVLKRSNVIMKLSRFLLVLAPVLVFRKNSGMIIGEPKLPAKFIK